MSMSVLFWMVHDAERAALEVQDFGHAVSWAARVGMGGLMGLRHCANPR
jgi:hypothetical protein